MSGVAWLAFAVGATAEPVPYASLGGVAAHDTVVPSYGSEAAKLHDAVEAAKVGDVNRAMALKGALQDPLAQRVGQWAILDNAATMVSFPDLRAADLDLSGWPRATRRRAAMEKALEAAAVPPAETLAFFHGADPLTPQGAMALAAAYQALDQADAAQTLIRRFWREKIFEADQQAVMRARFAAYITPADDAARLETLLYGPQGPAARAMLDLVGPDERALGEARMALRADRNDASDVLARVPPALQSDPGLAVDKAHFYRKRGLDVLAVSLVPQFPQSLPSNSDIVAYVWGERRALMNAALKTGDVQSAYASVSGHGFTAGPDYVEAEFFAGWLALTKLHDPALADAHFAKMQTAVTAPISLARVFYWRGRDAEARADETAASDFFSKAAPYQTTFYGQLSAEKLGRSTLSLGTDPTPTAAERQSFQAEDLVRAARLLEEAGEHDAVRSFILTAAERQTSAADLAQLIDLARASGDQDLGMRVARTAAQRGFFLPERTYPLLPVPQTAGDAEPAFMLAIARQESNFDPKARSGPGARGLMQLMPGTAEIMARKLGVSYSPARLQNADYNLRLGGFYLGRLVDDFGGSLLLASAGYNAGPGRPTEWTTYCGDPRGGATDPVDFIECIPFSETRNYVMRTMEATQVYRARLNGGQAPLTLAQDLKRGAWTPPVTATPALGPNTARLGGPVPDAQINPAVTSR
jgi:soluble lytic murein transglycosylase